jgi:hypothetical protein
MRPTKLAFAKVDTLEAAYVLVLGPTNPPDAEWGLWVDYIANYIKPGSRPRIVVMTEGGSPTAAQRAALSAVTDQYKNEAKVAVCTDSTMARGALTALSWFLPNAYRAFSHADVDRALQYLEITDGAGEVRSTIKVLQRQLGLSVSIR